jgi:hypothetical protein
VLCLEVTINGEQRVIAGIESAEMISARVAVYPELKESWITVDGEVVPDGQPSADAHWIAAALSVGDAVVIRIVEADSPAAPKLGRADPSVIPVPTDQIPYVCSFCGKGPHDTEGMITARWDRSRWDGNP